MVNTMRWTQERLEDHLRKKGMAAAPVAITRKPKAANKFGAEKVVVDGELIDSKLEARYLLQLKMEHRSVHHRQEREGQVWKHGDLMWFERQIAFELEGGVKIVIDFREFRWHRDGIVQAILVDTKGVLKQDTKNKLKQLKERYGFEVKLMYDADVMKVSV